VRQFTLIITISIILFSQCSKETTCACQDEPILDETAEAAPFEIEAEIEAEPEEDLSVFMPDPDVDLPVTEFREIWGYVVRGQEAALRRGLPVTDVTYFGAEVDMYGKLINVPERRNLSSFAGRVHLAVTCPGNALTYFTLMPGSSHRSELIDDLIAACANYDGLNIDFENIPARAGAAFLSFLRELRERLPDETILSVALYGRVRAVSGDVYDYARIAPLVDRIFVMAYDEHWSGGSPGPVSTIRWCRSVADYSLRVIGEEKLIMGIPFYGRAWADQNHSRALVYSTTERLLNTMEPINIRRENGTPAFNYNVNITVRVYYEDEYSISARLEMYKSMGVKAVGFWRVGQETPKVWSVIKISG